VWESLTPQITCMLAYWKILIALRHKANVTPAAPRRQVVAAAAEPVAGTSQETTTKPVDAGATPADKGRRDKGASEGPTTSGPHGGGHAMSPGLLKAERNVIRTLIFINITFVMSAMPMDFYFFSKKFAVFIYSCI